MKTKSAVVLLCLHVSFSSDFTKAQANFWQQTNGPYGGQVLCIASAPGGIIYIGTEYGGVFRSSDYGMKWSSASGGVLSALPVVTIAASSTGYIFAGTRSNGVYRSSTEGASWTPANIGLPVYSEIQYLAAGDSGHVFCSPYRRGIYRSTNYGESWT